MNWKNIKKPEPHVFIMGGLSGILMVVSLVNKQWFWATVMFLIFDLNVALQLIIDILPCIKTEDEDKSIDSEDFNPKDYLSAKDAKIKANIIKEQNENERQSKIPERWDELMVAINAKIEKGDSSTFVDGLIKNTEINKLERLGYVCKYDGGHLNARYWIYWG